MAEREARAVLDSVAASPDPVLEGRARLLLGRALVRREKLSAARDELALLPAGASASDRAEAALERARCLWRLERLDAALAEYDSIAGSAAPEGARATASWEAAREVKDARRWKDAADRLGRFAATFPENDYADDALWHRTRALLEIGEVNAALATDSLLASRAPDSPFRDECSFWVVRALADRRRSEEACVRLRNLAVGQPVGYWTLRARPIASSLGCTLPEPRAADPDPAALAAQAGADSMVAVTDEMRRAAILARWGYVDDAEREVAQLRRRMVDDRDGILAIARASARLGVPRGGMQSTASLRSASGASVLGGTFSSDAARLLYPVAYVDDVFRWSDEYGVDPFFVYAVMREESWFDAEAVSPVGARGLLQIMPTTGADLAHQAGVSEFRRSDLFDPPVNIRLGIFYLARLLERLDGEPVLALAAYNAGEKNAARWKYEENGTLDVDRTVAGITYRETYDYVQRVSVTREIYRALYEDEWPKLRALRDAVQPSN
jgi:soluble lytic murein transglycosylase